jgi:outer membrane protein OmpA-like peptidoglycan-associated protein
MFVNRHARLDNKLRPQCAAIASIDTRPTSEETVPGLFAGNKTNRNIRYALLAGTMMLPALAVPQASIAADGGSAQLREGAIILAQAPAQAPAIDPQTGKPVPKGPPPKGAQPQPKGPQSAQPPAGAAAPPAAAGGQPPGAPAPKPGVLPKSNQPVQTNVAPGGPPPAGAGAPPPAAAPPKVGVQPKAVQPLQGNVQPGGPPPAGAGAPPPAAPPPKVGVQPKAIQPLQGNVQPGALPPAGAGAPPPAAPPPKVGVQPKAIQPLQGNVQPAAPPPAGAGAPPPVAPPARVGVQPKGVQPPQGQQTVVPGAQPLPAPAAAAPPAAAPAAPPPAQAGVPANVPVPQPGAPPAPQAAPVTNVTVNVNQVRTQRQERVEAGGRVVIEEPGNRFIVRENGRAFVRHDETERFRMWGEPRWERRGAEQYGYISRPGGYQIITVTDGSGRLLRRIRRGPDGREVILIDNRVGPGVAVGLGVGLAAGVILGLAAPVITIPRERYIVDVSAAPAPLLYETLEAPPLVDIERPYSLDEIRYNVALRDRMRRIDIDSITFDTGSWEVTPEQQPKLQAVADAMQRILSRHPDEMFLIEGHTDAIGNDVDNLSLSDRRAESVAVILTNAFQVPPENLVTQGYGEQHLKVLTDGPSRENRRVTARRITPLLNGKMAGP